MKFKSLLQRANFLCLWLWIASCVNLKNVNDYAATSAQNIQQFEDLGYSFTKSCNDKCFIQQLDKKQFIAPTCDCQLSKEADSVTLVIYTAIKGYFDGLSNLSNNELTNYKYDALAKAIKEGDFGGLKINADNVDAYSKIATILSRAITDGYRKKQIAKYIGEANIPIKNLLNALQFNLVSNLSKTLETKRIALKSFYFDLFNDTTTSAYEKMKILEEWKAANQEIDAKKEQLISYGEGLNVIAQGHQQLYDNRNQLSGQNIKDLLQYTSDIKDIIAEINKLKNQD